MKRLSNFGDQLRSLLIRLVDRLSVCSHRKTTLPMTRWVGATGNQQRGATGDMYVVCLDCGRTLAYDWKRMRVGKQRAGRESSPAGPHDSK
ncbi:MAG: hypothetical protein KIT83_11400 [Bryobacterales bacterium]|nr:hypothetical protein [Bryobacterales bacterium]